MVNKLTIRDLEDKNINIELKIPSEFGYEKIAMATVATVASEIGFSPERIEDVKTAVSEACINAIEHGNQLHEDKNVIVIFNVGEKSLRIDVIDEGRPSGFKLDRSPDLEDKLRDGIQKRGWGLFLIEKLVDNVEIVNGDGDASTLRMIIHFEQKNNSTNKRGNTHEG
jgi:serine/threonine-protein kinase RsbW